MLEGRGAEGSVVLDGNGLLRFRLREVRVKGRVETFMEVVEDNGPE